MHGGAVGVGQRGVVSVGVCRVSEGVGVACVLQRLRLERAAVVVGVGPHGPKRPHVEGQAIGRVVAADGGAAVAVGSEGQAIAAVVAVADLARVGHAGGMVALATGQRQPTGAPHHVAGGIVVLYGGTGLGLDGLAQALVSVVNVAAGDRLRRAAVLAVTGDGGGLAEHVACNADADPFRNPDAHDAVFAGRVECLEGVPRGQASRVGHQALEAADVLGGGGERA